MHNQSSKQKLFRVSKSKNHHRKASKQASKKEAKIFKTQAKETLLPLQVLPTQTPGKNQSIHPHTPRTLFEKKIPNQLSLSQLNRILLLPDPDPNPTPPPHSTKPE
jgi:hypothetical protein